MVRNRYNTPGIIKFSFWSDAARNPNATYACLNSDDARLPRELEGRSVGITGDAARVIAALADG